jgi:hypothetical protein
MGITERWKGVERLKRSIDDKGVITYTGQRVWDVDSVTNEVDAIDAVVDAALGSGHPLSGLMTVSSNSANEERKGLWAVTANYTTIPPNNGTGGEFDAPEFDWEEGNETFQADTDIFGNPLVNSALDAYEGGYPRSIPTGFYVVTMDQPFFDAKQAASFRGVVFDDELVTPYGTFDKLETRCISIRPKETLKHGQKKQKVIYRIEVRLKAVWPEMPKEMSPFDISFVDQGAHGWANDGKAYDIVSAVTPFDKRTARLNGDGTPFDSNESKLWNNKTAKAIDAPSGATVQDHVKCKKLFYFGCPRAQCAALNLPKTN